MSDREFERRLERMFAQPPRVDDAEAFARRVEARLERGWGVRRILVGAAGAVGGLIAATQLVNAEVLRHLKAVDVPAIDLAAPRLTQTWLASGMDGAAMNGEVLWMAAAMLGLAAAFAATRWAEGF